MKIKNNVERTTVAIASLGPNELKKRIKREPLLPLLH
jgi:hypothetical protein